MARRLTERLGIEGWLVADGAVHVGGVGASADTDLALAEDGQGRCYVPGTSLAGALRAWMATTGEDRAQSDALWGRAPGREKTDDDPGPASLIFVEDALVEGTVRQEIRQGVGIDRWTGAAASNIKYDRAVLPRGTRLSFRMTVEIPARDDAVTPAQARQALAGLLAALEGGHIRLGAARTRGLGRVRASQMQIWEERLDSRAGLLAALRGRRTPAVLGAAPVSPGGRARLSAEVTWRPRGPLMVKAEEEGLFVDGLPLVTGERTDDGEVVRLLLPGSALKGVLRSEAERIVRTLRCVESERVDPEQPARDAFLRQIESPLVSALFGAAGQPADQTDRDEPGVPLPGLAALTLEDCHAEARLPVELWRTLAEAEDGCRKTLAQTGGRLQDARLVPSFHVAVDRWTSGAAEHLLFSVLEPHGFAWEPIRLHLDLARMSEAHRPRGLALLLLVLRELGAGRVPLGYGTLRGLGAVELSSVRWSGSNLPAWLEPIVDRELGADLGNLEPSLKATLQAAWQAFCKEASS